MFDPTEPETYKNKFQTEDCSATLYGSCKRDVPSNAPSSSGIGFTLRAFVDSDHAGDSITRCSGTGFLCSLAILLSLFIRRNRVVVIHQVLVLISQK